MSGKVLRLVATTFTLLCLLSSSSEAMMARRNIGNILTTLAEVAREHGLPVEYMAKFADIESGYRPNTRTGSYKGLFQLSSTEFRRHGGRGNIFNAKENAAAFAKLLKTNIKEFASKMGREPTGAELYLLHQQGTAGGPAHLRNPDRPAWQNMAETGEGRRKGKAWAKKAIWGNIPRDQRKKFGKVENVTSGQFTNMWKARYERAGGQAGAASATFDDGHFEMPMPGKKPGLPDRRRDMLDAGLDADASTEMATVPTRRSKKFDSRLVMDADPLTGGPKEDARLAENSPESVLPVPKVPTFSEFDAATPDDPTPAPTGSKPAAVLPGARQAKRAGRSQGGTRPPGDDWAGKAFGGTFGELYARPDQGEALLGKLSDLQLPEFKTKKQPHWPKMPTMPPLLKDFFGSG